jgi:isoleucyl-tRNA synthetase
MQLAREVVVLCRKLREEHRVKVRQPLARLTIVHRSGEIRQMATEIGPLIADEMNVKEVTVEADESIFTTVSVKPNFKTLGKRCGSKLGAIKNELARWGATEVASLEEGGSVLVEGEALTLEDVILERSTKGDAAVATNGHTTVVLDTSLSPELVAEGIAREFISQVQSARKSLGLEVSDRIAIQWWTDNENTLTAIGKHAESIQSEVLARTMVTSQALSDAVTSLDVNGIQVEVSISKL